MTRSSNSQSDTDEILGVGATIEPEFTRKAAVHISEFLAEEDITTPLERAEQMQPNWQKISIDVNGKLAPSTYAPAKKPAVFLDFLMGLKGAALYYKNKIRAMNKIGISMQMSAFPDPGKDVDFLDDFEALAHRLFIEADTLPEHYSPDMPRVIVTHSAGGMMLLKLLKNPETAKLITDRIDGIVMVSSFLTSPHRDDTLQRIAYKGYSKVFADTQYTKAPLDNMKKTEHAIDVLDIIDQDLGLPTHRQTQYMMENGEALYEEIMEGEFPDCVKDFPILMMSGVHDFSACPIKQNDVSKKMNAEYRAYDAGHNPITESVVARRHFVEFVQKIVMQKQEQTHNLDHQESMMASPLFPPAADYVVEEEALETLPKPSQNQRGRKSISHTNPPATHDKDDRHDGHHIGI